MFNLIVNVLTFTHWIHNTQGLRYVQGDSVGKPSPLVVQCLCSTSEAQNGRIQGKKGVFTSTNRVIWQ